VKKVQDPLTIDSPKPPPKKGSYAEILARANAAQAAVAKVGVIKHKSVEGGLRKKARLSQRRESKDIPKQSAKTKVQIEKLPLSRKGGEREKLVKDRAGESTYKGTSRVKPEMPAYKGTARPNNPSPTKSASRRCENSDRNRSRSTSLNPKPGRYRYASEEDDEGEEDYESDVSSDMEAAPFELEEEEHISLKTAKREDEEALREEMRLKKQKDEKKKMLAALAAKRR
jgi:protein SPT2